MDRVPGERRLRFASLSGELSLRLRRLPGGFPRFFCLDTCSTGGEERRAATSRGGETGLTSFGGSARSPVDRVPGEAPVREEPEEEWEERLRRRDRLSAAERSGRPSEPGRSPDDRAPGDAALEVDLEESCSVARLPGEAARCGKGWRPSALSVGKPGGFSEPTRGDLLCRREEPLEDDGLPGGSGISSTTSTPAEDEGGLDE